ncbi:MAG: IS1 family transposase [Elusimicrobia bacterium]|nr:IS1 family transposase [Elusimicrobiota bacterium]
MMIAAHDEEFFLISRFQELRWKAGLRCPRCRHQNCSVHARGKNGRRKLRCSGCGRTFNDLTGTPLARTHLPLAVWAKAARLMAAGPQTCSALSVKLGIKLATAWRVRKILTNALKDADLRQALVPEDHA